MSQSTWRLMLFSAFTFAALVTQPGCLFRKHKVAAPAVTPAPIRIVLLPLNVSAADAELRWVSLAAPVLMAKVVENAPDIEPVPLWEALPTALETLGASRTATDETVAFIAARLSARWGTEGEISPAKNGFGLMLDFIPAKSSPVPFRYQKSVALDSLAPPFREAFEQFLRYVVARPMGSPARTSPDSATLRQIAEALDREYGWFVQADPGKSDKVVADLARSDGRLARLLFSPTLYPALNAPATGKSASQNPPQPETRSSEPPPNQAQPQDTEPASSTVAVAGATTTVQETEHVSASASSTVPLEPQASSPAGAAKNYAEPPAKTETGADLSKDVHTRSKPPAGALNRGFVLQVFSSQNRQLAETVAAALRKAGLEPQLETSEVPSKGTWYRIRLQGYESKQSALEAGERLVKRQIIKEYWIVP